MYPPAQYAAAERLEAYLGDPFDPESSLSFKRLLQLDEAELYPEDACRLLNHWHLHLYYIPIEEGGQLSSYEEVLSLIRAIARRDITCAIAHAKTYLGAAALWLAGTEKQKQRLARIIKEEGQVSLGLTEKAHGSDLIANEFAAVRSAQGYELTGEKWVINNATHGDALTIFARTQEEGGPRGFSLFLVEKRSLERGTYTNLAKIRTLGVRGADISGIRLKGCRVSEDSLIGTPGSALEVALKAFNITRAIISSLSLGAGDTALRIVLEFALERRLYGESVFSIAHARRVLVDAFLDLLICESVAIAAARVLHVATEQMSVWAAVVKYFVPTRIEAMIRNVAVVLGARYYLREALHFGAFQKILRDAALVSLFDGSTAVNLNSLGSQLRQLGREREKTTSHDSQDREERLHNIFSLQTPLPPFDHSRLELFNRGHDDLLQDLDAALSHLHTLSSDSSVDSELLRSLISLTEELRRQLLALDSSVSELAAEYGAALSKSAEIFEAAKSHCTLHAAACCLRMWLHNREEMGEFFGRGEWVVMSLERLLIGSGGGGVSKQGSSSRYAGRVAEEMVRLYEEGRMFSIIPLQLPRTGYSYGTQRHVSST